MFVHNKILLGFISISLLIHISCLNVAAQEYPYNQYPHKPNNEYFKSYLHTGKNIITGPAHWNKKEWFAAGAVIAGGTLLYIYDDEIRQSIVSLSSPTLDGISRYGFEPMGQIYPFVIFGGYFVYGVMADNKKARQIALGGAQVIVFSVISTEILKHIFHRHRPNDNIPPDPYMWDGPFKGWNHTSFPSRHTTLAFATATLLQQVYKDRPWVGILGYSLAIGTGLSRIYENEHWPTDILIGAALGFAIGRSAFNIMKRKNNLALGVTKYGGISLCYNIGN